MNDVINLRTARKAAARAKADARAATNRLAFGRTKAEKASSAVDIARHDDLLDGVKRDA